MDELEMRKKRLDVAPGLRRRINALKAAKSFGELPTNDPLGKWHQLSGDLAGMWAGKLTANYRLLVRPEGSAALAAVAVTVIDIADYH